MLVKSLLDENLSNHCQPSFIVTDFSWALISSCLNVFNGCNINSYLNVCYKIIVEKDVKSFFYLKTKVILCSTHFLKMVINKIRPLKTSLDNLTDRKIKNSFIYSFTLLQNSTSLEEFNSYILNIYVMFLSKYKTESFKNAFNSLRKGVLYRKLTTEIYKEVDTKFDLNKMLEYDYRNENIFANEIVENIKAHSPFSIYFNKKCSEIRDTIYSENLNEIRDSNEYYFPEFLNVIENYLYLMPLWSGILINRFCELNQNFKKISRFTNNPVEFWFKFLKFCLLSFLLKKPRKCCPSQYCRRVYKK